MSKCIIVVLSLLLLLHNARAQNVVEDSLVIRNYTSRDYKAAISNYSAVEDENGILYFANENGILEYDGSEWRLMRIKDYSTVLSLERSKDGRIYVGGVNEFGYLSRNATGQFEYYSLRDYVDPAHKLIDIWQIKFFKNDVYFQSYESIIRYDGEVAHVIPVKDSYVISLNDKVYLSTYDKGIAELKGDSIDYMSLVLNLNDDAAFKTLPALDGKKLVLTEFHGVYLMDPTDFSYETWDTEANDILTKHGLYEGVVWDDSTYLFSSTENGLYWVSDEGNILRTVNHDDGLSTNKSREIFRDRRGKVWLPSRGINYLDWPENIDTTGFRTLMRYVEIGDSTIYVNIDNGRLSTKENINSLVFHFATPGYDKTDLEYSYYLEGFDAEWSAWKNDVKKEYTNLENRAYTFHVKARLANGKVSIPSTVQFNIPAPWYQNFWVYFFGILVLAVIIWVGIMLRMAHLKTLNDKLEKVINDRTKELVKQKEHLHSANEELTLANTELDNFVYRSSHDLVAPLKSLKGLIGITQTEKEEEERQKYLEMMTRSVEKLEDFIKSILEYSSNANGEIDNQEIRLNDMLDNIVEDLKYFERAGKIELKRHFESEFSFTSDPKRIKIILSNLIANSIKYHNYNQSNPHIVVTSTKTDAHIDISIADNGQGINSNHLDKIFDMFYRASENSQGSGLGLYIVKDTVSKLNGKISAKSEYGKGTTFSMRFSLN